MRYAGQKQPGMQKMRVTSDPASIENQNWDHSFERFTVNSGSRISFPFYILTFSHFHVSTENQLRS